MKKGTMTAIIGGAALLAVASTANAYDFAFHCGDIHHGAVKLNALNIARNTHSMPNGTSPALALSAEAFNWQLQTTFNVDATLTSSGESIVLGDGQSDFARTTSAGTDGNRGLTTYAGINNCTFGGGLAYYTEADAHVLDTLTFENPDESWWGVTDVPGRVVIEHEIGHMLGLGHAEGIFNIMRTQGYDGTPHNPFIGGSYSHVDVLGDDANGLFALHYAQRTHTNLFASAQRLDGNNYVVTTNQNATINWCRSWKSFSLAFSEGNNGSTTQTFNQKLNFSSVGPGDQTNGLLLGFWDQVTLVGHAETTHYVTFDFPDWIGPGFYWITHTVDDTNSITEEREGDNFVHDIMTVQVNDC